MRLYRMLVRWLVLGVQAVIPAAPPGTTTVKWNEQPFAKRRYGKAIAGGAQSLTLSVVPVIRLLLGLFTPQRLAILAILAVALALDAEMGYGGGAVVMGEVVPVIDTKRAELDRALKEMEVTQSAYEGKSMPTAVAEQFDTLCEEIKGLQDEVDTLMEREGRVTELKKWRGTVDHPTLPGDIPGETKLEPHSAEGAVGPVAGYVQLSDMVTASKAWQDFVEAGAPQGHVPVATIGSGLLHAKRLPDGTTVVPINRDERKLLTEFWETKTIPVIGAGIIEPSRLAGITQVQKDQELRLRDVMSISQTGTDSVSYVRRSAITRAAAETAAGGTKPEAGMSFDLITDAISTIAVHMPVQTQQLADWGLLRSEIDNFLLYDLGRREEEQMLYGDGTGVNLAGLFLAATAVPDIAGNGRYVGTVHTFIDVVRMGITDVKVAGYSPNAVLLHPFDWETILLERGTDNRYVWVVVTDNNGSRLWGLPIVESTACEATAGDATEARNLLVGDFRVGCTLVDRMAATIMVGMIANQFIQNLRTILAEERVAFPVRAPAAFALFETQAAVP